MHINVNSENPHVSILGQQIEEFAESLTDRERDALKMLLYLAADPLSRLQYRNARDVFTAEELVLLGDILNGDDEK